MLEIRPLKYFVVSADVSSFSETAKILYTTQSNVSKTIAALEKQLGVVLFQREAKGVTLTAEGRRFYEKANAILSNLEELESELKPAQGKLVSISANPSSWFANSFSAFYQTHAVEGVEYRIWTDNTPNILRRVREGRDEIGFISVFPDQTEQLRYDLKRYQLDFACLREMDAMLYFRSEWEITGRSVVRQRNLRTPRCVQMVNDPYIRYRDWQVEGQEAALEPQAVVTTNSDYIVNLLLEKNHLANVSCDTYLSYSPEESPGVRLLHREGKILYGVLTRCNASLSQQAKEFVEFVRGRIKNTGTK